MAKWYYLVDGKEAGPVEPADLKHLADAGRLKPHDRIRRNDMAELYQAKQVKGLFAADQSQVTTPTNTKTAEARAVSDVRPARISSSEKKVRPRRYRCTDGPSAAETESLVSEDAGH